MSRAGLFEEGTSLYLVFMEGSWARRVSIAELSDRLSALRLMSEQARALMEASLVRHGQLTPLVCCRSEEGLVVVDGFKRLRAAERLGWTELRVVIHDVDCAGSAKLMLWQSNQGCGLSDLEQAWLVRSLYREEGMTQPQIAHLLRRHKSWVSRRLMLAEGLSEGVEADVRLGLLSATLAREVARLPRGNQESAARVFTRRGMTTRQAARLVDHLMLVPDDAARERYLERALEARTGPEGPARAKTSDRRTPGEWLIADIDSVKRSATRLHARLLQRPLCRLGEQAQVLAEEQLKQLRSGLLSLCRTIEPLVEERVEGSVVTAS